MKASPIEPNNFDFSKYVDSFLKWAESKKMPQYALKSCEITARFFVRFFEKSIHYFRYWFLGKRGAYRFEGPGELLLATRIEPTYFNILQRLSYSVKEK